MAEMEKHDLSLVEKDSLEKKISADTISINCFDKMSLNSKLSSSSLINAKNYRIVVIPLDNSFDWSREEVANFIMSRLFNGYEHEYIACTREHDVIGMYVCYIKLKQQVKKTFKNPTIHKGKGTNGLKAFDVSVHPHRNGTPPKIDNEMFTTYEEKKKPNHQQINLTKIADSTELQHVLVKNNAMDYLKYFSTMKKHFEEFKSKDVDDSNFKYQFPEHLMKIINEYDRGDLDLMENRNKRGFIEAILDIYEWFITYCNGKIERKRALVIYSERCTGKTTFAKSLVGNNDDFLIHVKTVMDAQQFQKPAAKLVILDDLTFDFKTNNELYKGLMASDEVTVRSPYTIHRFYHGLPTIILTNEKSYINKIFLDNNYNCDCHGVYLNGYLGPKNTRPVRTIRANTILNNAEIFNIDPRRLEPEDREDDNWSINS